MSHLLFRLFHHGIEFPLDCKRNFINPRWNDLRPLLYLWTSWSNLFVPDTCHLKMSKHVLSSTSQPLRWSTLIKFIRRHGQRQAAESARRWSFLFAQKVPHWMNTGWGTSYHTRSSPQTTIGCINSGHPEILPFLPLWKHLEIPENLQTTIITRK